MGLSPIPSISGVGPARAPNMEREVEPPFALYRSGRMGDDAYKGSGETAERGMEEEESESSDATNDEAATEKALDGVRTGVNFFA